MMRANYYSCRSCVLVPLSCDANLLSGFNPLGEVFISGRNGSSRAWFLNEQPETLAAQSNLNPLNLSRFRMMVFPKICSYESVAATKR
jgi:hypothetical protein